MASYQDDSLEDGITPEEVRLALKTICRSRSLIRCPRLTSLLRYIVEQTMNGYGDDLKEYAIGFEVFDRGESFDPRIDTIVRVHAGRLRKRLAEYYAADGRADSLVIDVPKGSYVPAIRRRASTGTRAGFSTQSSPKSAVTARETTNQLLPEGERVQATIVFSRLRDYSVFIEENEAETVDSFMNRLRDRVAHIVQEHGGTLNRCSGDEFVALFGIGSSDEDAFLQAVRSTLAVHQAVLAESTDIDDPGGPSLSVSSGIDTGTVRVRETADPAQVWLVAGAPTKTAPLLALNAGPNQILVSRETNGLLSPVFKSERCNPLQFEPASEPVIPYRLVNGAKLPASMRVDTASPFVGRKAELARLHECREKALKGNGQFVSIVGEAGVGKTRLVYEFERQLDKDHLTAITVRCQPSDVHTPLFPFVQALKELLQIGDASEDGSDEESVLSRIKRIDSNLEPYLPVLLHLLSIPSDTHPLPDRLTGSKLRLILLEAVMAVLTLAARERTMLLVLEDWHWSDQASRDALDQLIELLPACSLMAVVTSRPEYSFSVSSHHSPIRLGPLNSEESLELIESLLSVHSISEEVTAALHDRTAGNPFFLREICRNLAELGLPDEEDGSSSTVSLPVELPVSVRSVIRARLQRLSVTEMQTLRVAAVIGQEFSERLLRRVVDSDGELTASLVALRAAGHIQQVAVLPEPSYRFHHVLVQETIYDGLLKHQRKVLHERIGQAIETLAADRIAESAERLVLHFQAAENWTRTIHYAQLATDRSWRMSQFAEALAMLEIQEQAARKLPAGGEQERTLVNALLQQERVCETVGHRDRQEELIGELIALLEPAGSSARLADVYIRKGDLCTLRSQFSAGEAALRMALEMSREIPAADLELRALRSLGFLFFRGDEPEKALPLAEELLNRDRELQEPRVLLHDLISLSSVLRSLGRHSRALEVAMEARQIAREHDLRDEIPNTSTVIASAYQAMGELNQALVYLEEALEHSPHQNPIPLGSARKPALLLLTMANVHFAQGHEEESLKYCQDAVDWGRRSKMAEELAAALRTLGLTLLALNRSAEALPHMKEAEDLYARLEDFQNGTAVKQAMAGCFEQQGAYPEAIGLMEAVLAFRRQDNDRQGELQALESLARLTRAAGRPTAEALHFLRQALALAESLQDSRRKSRLDNTIGILEWQRGHYETAFSHYQSALKACEQIGDEVHAGLMLNSIGVTLRKLGRLTEAHAALESALERHRANGSFVLESHALAAIGDIFYDQGKFEFSIQAYEESLGIRMNLEDREGEGWMLHHLARVWNASGREDKARPLLEQALAIASQDNILKLKEACLFLSGSGH